MSREVSAAYYERPTPQPTINDVMRKAQAVGFLTAPMARALGASVKRCIAEGWLRDSGGGTLLLTPSGAAMEPKPDPRGNADIFACSKCGHDYPMHMAYQGRICRHCANAVRKARRRAHRLLRRQRVSTSVDSVDAATGSSVGSRHGSAKTGMDAGKSTGADSD